MNWVLIEINKGRDEIAPILIHKSFFVNSGYYSYHYVTPNAP